MVGARDLNLRPHGPELHTGIRPSRRGFFNVSVRFFYGHDSLRPDLKRFPCDLLHDVLQSATGPCPSPLLTAGYRFQSECQPWFPSWPRNLHRR
jgi:hypothetical protein